MAEGALELVEEQGAEAAREDAHGQEEAGAAGDPAVAAGGDAAAGDDAVQVRMEGQVLPPGVQHAEEADLGAEMLGIGGDLAREGEDNVEVGAVQQLVVALGDPGGALRAAWVSSIPSTSEWHTMRQLHGTPRPG